MWIFYLITTWLLVKQISSQFVIEMTIMEGSPVNTLLGNLNFYSPSSSLSNQLIPDSIIHSMKSTHSVNYQLLTRTPLFKLNGTSGDLSTRSKIDRESICPQSDQQTQIHHSITDNHDDGRLNSKSPSDTICRIRLQVLKFDPDLTSSSGQGSSQHVVLLIDILVLDVNDNAPTWSESTIYLQIPEHCPLGTRFPLPTAFDTDCGPMNTTVSYLIKPVEEIDQNMFPISDALQLDTELISTGSNAIDISQQLWSINGNVPISCSRRKFKLWLRVTRDLEYDRIDTSMREHLRSPHDGYQTNSVQIRQAQLRLIAVDGGHPVPLTGTVLINVSVIDINDHPPQFKTRQQKKLNKDRLEELIELEENTPVGRTIYTAKALDVDTMDQNRLEYSLDTSAISAARHMFEINPKTGEVILLKSPDYEIQKSFNLPLIVSDGKHQANLNLIIFILNLNDHAPKIIIQPIDSSSEVNENHPNSQTHLPMHARTTQLFITEHEPPGRFIATVTVSDDDDSNMDDLTSNQLPHHPSGALMHLRTDLFNFGPNIRCQLSHTGLNLQPLFEGASNQFKLVTSEKFDREQQKEHFITLTCFDRGAPPLSSQVGLHLIILDINDHPPRFKHSQMIAYLKEKQSAGTILYTVEATDPDVGINSQLGFSLTDQDNIDFTIDPFSGIVTNLREFDYEQQNQYNLTVIVKDRYAHVTDNRSKSADLTVKNMNPVNEQRSHSIRGTLLIYIQDVNDCPPLFGNSLYQLSVPEDAKVNYLVGQIRANDSDATDANNQIHYLIKHQSSDQPVQQFRVSSNGYIFVARGGLDREKKSSYTFFLVAIDSGVPPLSSSTQVHIYITDVNDNAPIWVYPAHNNHVINMTISEPVGYRLAQLNAIDPDENENGEVVFRILQLTKLVTNINDATDFPSQSAELYIDSDKNTLRKNQVDNLQHATVDNLFDLDPTSGSIYVGRSMNRNDIGSFKLVVEASDNGKPAKVNHRVLQVNILHHLPSSFLHDPSVDPSIAASVGDNRFPFGENANGGKPIENDLLIIVIMVAITLIISLALIVAILFLRCGICPSNRPLFHYNSALPNDFRRDITQAHPHHHLEEVFRDTSVPHDHMDEFYNPSGVDHGGTCKQYSEGGYQSNETETMCHSYLSAPGSDPWMVSAITPKKDNGRGLDSIKFNHLGGTLVRVQSPIEHGKRTSVIGTTFVRTRQCDHRNAYGINGTTQSPENEMKQLLNHQMLSTVNNCSTFRASCSHNGQQRASIACNRSSKCEDMDSMDSGHGRSCSTTDNGLLAVSTSQDQTTFCRGMNNCTPSKDSLYIREKLSRPHLKTRPRSGTLPSLLNEESLTESMLSAKSTTVLCDTKQNTDSDAPTSKSRQSVTWLMDPTYHQICSQPSHTTCLSDPHSPNQLIETNEPTFVLIDAHIDPLGYAQLIQPSRDSIDSPPPHACDSFPTSFV